MCPPTIRVQAGNRPLLKGHAVGTQNYVCLPSATGFAWTLFGPQATLFDDDDKQTITHFLSSNPDEAGLARPTWQHSRDTSTVWASLFSQSSDPAFVASGAIPWFLLQVVGDEYGPTGGAPAHPDDVDSAGEHPRRRRPRNRLRAFDRHRQEGVGPL